MTTLERLKPTSGDMISIGKWLAGGIFAALVAFISMQATVKALATEQASTNTRIEKLDREKQSKDAAEATRREILSVLHDIKDDVKSLRDDVRADRGRRR